MAYEIKAMEYWAYLDRDRIHVHILHSVTQGHVTHFIRCLRAAVRNKEINTNTYKI